MRKIITTEAGELIDFETVFEECLILGDTPAPDRVGRFLFNPVSDRPL